MLRRQRKGGWQMLNEMIATALLIVLAWFAAGSSQIADERSQIKRGNKWAKDNYPPTY
jgi:catalase (peroxidase I)